MQFQEVLVVLGSPNFADGQLGPIAMDRVNYCWEQYQNQVRPILCTGGFGVHFNTSPWSHASLLKKELMAKGVPEQAFLPLAISGNTVDDAVKCKLVLHEYSVETVTIITSAYHMARVELVFNEILSHFSKQYVGIEHLPETPEILALRAHEFKAIEEIKLNGLYY